MSSHLLRRFPDLAYNASPSRVPNARMDIRIFVGPPGSGKLACAVTEAEEFGSYYLLKKPLTKTGTVWFDGYNSEETIVIDDFDSWINFFFFTSMLHPFPLNLPGRRHKTYKCNFTRVFITSKVDPSEWYSDKRVDGWSSKLDNRLASATVIQMTDDGQ